MIKVVLILLAFDPSNGEIQMWQPAPGFETRSECEQFLAREIRAKRSDQRPGWTRWGRCISASDLVESNGIKPLL